MEGLHSPHLGKETEPHLFTRSPRRIPHLSDLLSISQIFLVADIHAPSGTARLHRNPKFCHLSSLQPLSSHAEFVPILHVSVCHVTYSDNVIPIKLVNSPLVDIHLPTSDPLQAINRNYGKFIIINLCPRWNKDYRRRSPTGASSGYFSAYRNP